MGRRPGRVAGIIRKHHVGGLAHNNTTNKTEKQTGGGQAGLTNLDPPWLAQVGNGVASVLRTTAEAGSRCLFCRCTCETSRVDIVWFGRFVPARQRMTAVPLSCPREQRKLQLGWDACLAADRGPAAVCLSPQIERRSTMDQPKSGRLAKRARAWSWASRVHETSGGAAAQFTKAVLAVAALRAATVAYCSPFGRVLPQLGASEGPGHRLDTNGWKPWASLHRHRGPSARVDRQAGPPRRGGSGGLLSNRSSS